jgi:outer membrane protein assembly factor BamA
LQARFAASRPEGRQLSAAGRTLKSIDVDGLPEPVRADFLSRLPVREGDTLSRDSLEAISQAARDFDEHFRIRITVFLTDDDQVRMQIAVTR